MTDRSRSSLEQHNLSHHGEGASILTERDLFIAKCVATWIETARAAGHGWYGNAWLPHEPDFQKSRLFWRLRAGKKPLPHPPPCAYSCPWYEVVEEIRPHWAYELAVMDGLAVIAQCGYGIEKMSDDQMPEIVTFGPWRFKVWKGPSPYGSGLSNIVPIGWYIERIANG